MSTEFTFGEYSDRVIRVSLADIAEHIIDVLASTKNLNVRMIQDSTGTEINWDKGSRLASIHGDQESAAKAYDDLTSYIKAFIGVTVGGVDYTPTVSARIYGPELARGICFCLRKPNEGPETSSARNPPDAKGAEEGFRTFYLYPAHLSAQEKAVARTISSGLRCSSEGLVGGMRGFLTDDITIILDKFREKLPASDRVYIEVEATLGKNLFLEQDIKNYNLATFKLDIHDFRLIRLGDVIKKVFQRRWMGECVAKLETLLPVLGYTRSGTPQTTMEIYLQEERSNGQFYNAVWLAGLVPKEGQEVQGLKLLKSRVQLRSCYKADILNGGERLDMILESSVYKNDHKSAGKNISRLISSKIYYAPKRGLILDREGNGELFHSAGIFFKRYSKQTRTKWVRGGIIVTLIEEMEGDGKTFCTVKVSSKHLEDLLNSRAGIAPFSEILEAVVEYLDSCDEVTSHSQFLEGISDRNPTEGPCSLQDHEINKCYTPQAGPKNGGGQPTAQVPRRRQIIDNDQTPTRKRMGCGIESGFETSDPTMDGANETAEPGYTGSHTPLVDFLTGLHEVRSGGFCDIMGAQDSALPNYPALLPTITTSGGRTTTDSPELESTPTRPALSSTGVDSRYSFGETSSANSLELHTGPTSDRHEFGTGNGKLTDTKRTEDVGFGALFCVPEAETPLENKPMLMPTEGGENVEQITTHEAIIIKDDFTPDPPAGEELIGPSHAFNNSEGLEEVVQEGEKLTGRTHGQSAKEFQSQPEHTGVAGHLETILSGRRFGGSGASAKSAQSNAEPTDTPSERSSPTQTLYRPSDSSSTDFETPMALGQELSELQEEISALNEAAGFN